eukprot:205392_1
MALSAENKKCASPPVVYALTNVVPQTKFEINHKDKQLLFQHVHYIVNHLFPLTDEPYDKDTDISKSSYTLSVIQGGITNLLYLLTPKSGDECKSNDQASGHKLLVRIYGENTEVLIDRDREEKLFYELGNVGFGPKLYGIFGNGRMEQWYDNAHTVKLHEQKHCKKISATLAAMHSIRPALLKAEESESSLWKIVDKWYNIASNLEFKENADKQAKYEQLNWNNIRTQIQIMRSFLPSDANDDDMDKLFEFMIAQQPDDETKQLVQQRLTNKINRIATEFMFDYVFTHNDLLGGNILHVQETKEIKFVDFEYGAYNYRAFDFANHFCEYAGFDCDWKKHFPDRNHMKQFVNDYVDALCGNDEYIRNVTLDVVRLFKKENGFSERDYNQFLEDCCEIIINFSMVDHYFWGLWGVVQAMHSPINFEFMQYAHERLLSGYQFSLTLLPKYLKFVTNKACKI